MFQQSQYYIEEKNAEKTEHRLQPGIQSTPRSSVPGRSAGLETGDIPKHREKPAPRGEWKLEAETSNGSGHAAGQSGR